MRAKYIIMILIACMQVNCSKKETRESGKPIFKPALEQTITNLVDTLKNISEEIELLSIQFFNPNHFETSCNMRIFKSDWYASGSIDGYVKFNNTVIAIYNIKNDYFELVNKNAITYFIDTLDGFKDVGVWETSEHDIEIPQFCYSIYSEDHIAILPERTFGSLSRADLIRKPKCKGGIIFIPPE